MSSTKFFGHPFIPLDTVDSTNNYATKLIKQGDYEDGTVIMADFQTEGRGRRNKNWQSSKGMNLTFSLIRKTKNLLVSDQFKLTQLVSLSILEALHDLGLTEAKIKWPNDLLVRDQKIAGILIENNLLRNTIECSTIGIGINVNQENFDDPNATSLKKESIEVDRFLVLQKILENINVGWYQMGFPGKSKKKELYLNHLFGYQEFKKYLIQGQEVEAEIIHVEDSGILQLREKNTEKLYSCNLDEITWLR